MSDECPVVIPNLGKKSGYYDIGGIEVIDVIKAKLTPEQYQGYLLGNIIKYSLRMNWKEDFSKDAGKCHIYAQWLKEISG